MTPSFAGPAETWLREEYADSPVLASQLGISDHDDRGDLSEGTGIFTDRRHEMCQYEAMLFRAARIAVDVSLHMVEMSLTRQCAS